MNLLAFDTSTERLSVALQRGSGPVTLVDAEGGPRASATLIPAIQGLLADAGIALRQLDAIVFGRGPGSFTGLRTACSVAQGLGWGTGLPVLGIETLMAVADEARAQANVTQVVAVLDARMDEVYTASYEFDGTRWLARAPLALLAPQAVVVPHGWALAGNAFQAYGERLPTSGPRIEALPAAGALLRLAPRMLAAGQARPAAEAAPLYIRDKVAQTTDERAAARASRTV